MNVPRNLFWFVSLWIITKKGLAECNMLEGFQTACPYSNFCMVDSLLKNTNQSDSVACCWDCFCDEDCYTYGDCCPDIESLIPQPANITELKCVSSLSKTAYTRPSNFKDDRIRKYRMFDSCPADYKDDDGTSLKCVNEGHDAADYDDIVVVSASNGRTYKNKHCATCHGVTEIARWNLNMQECADDLYKFVFIASTAQAYILEHCLLNSIPPETLVVNSRLLECDGNMYSSCPDNAEGSGVTRETIDGCNNGPFMPVSISEYSEKFKNALCHKCRTKTQLPYLCPVDDKFLKSMRVEFSVLLQSTKVFKETPDAHCSESEILDCDKKTCLTLTCPHLEAVNYGRCYPIYDSFVSSVLTVRVVFSTDDEVLIQGSVQMYTDRESSEYHKRFQKMFSKGECKFTGHALWIRRELTSTMLAFTMLEMNIQASETCTVKMIWEMVNKQKHITETLPLNNITLLMHGRVTFYQLSTSIKKVNYVEDIISVWGQQPRRPLYLSVMCPHVVCDVNKYSSLKDRCIGTGLGHVTDRFSILSETLEGSYALSENEIAVCSHHFFSNSSKATFTAFCLPFMLLIQALVVLLYMRSP